MINLETIQVGDKVCFQPPHLPKSEWENGIVKEIPEDSTYEVRVVYNCGDDWDNYKNYSSALTHKDDLALGWK